jgi:hypothetical protein
MNGIKITAYYNDFLFIIISVYLIFFSVTSFLNSYYWKPMISTLKHKSIPSSFTIVAREVFVPYIHNQQYARQS